MRTVRSTSPSVWASTPFPRWPVRMLRQYILPDDQTVEIQAGETVTVAMHNKLVPEVPTVPQTG